MKVATVTQLSYGVSAGVATFVLLGLLLWAWKRTRSPLTSHLSPLASV